jgi:hypothetical protein
MAGTLIVSNLTTDTDNTFIVRSNTGTTLFSANTTGIDVANSIGATAITNDKILSVANTKISGNIISSQIAPSVTLTTPLISGNLNFDANGTSGIRLTSANTLTLHTTGTEDMRIDSVGNVMIGTTTSQTGAKLSVTGGIQGTITSGTVVASTSGTSIDFTNLPSWVKRITVMFNQVSTSGSAYKYIRLGTSGGIVSSNYGSTSSLIYGSNSCEVLGESSAFLIRSDVATERLSGHAVLTLVDASNYIWSFSSIVSNTLTTTRVWHSAGFLSLGGVCTQLRLLASNGSDTFDNGSINILYEG